MTISIKAIKKEIKLNSCPNAEQKGSNINLKLSHKRYSSQKEKEFFLKKLKEKRKQNCVRIMNFIMVVTMGIIAASHMGSKN